MENKEITIPFNFKPRDYQLPSFKAADNEILRIFLVWHRRSGKDKSLINLIAKKCMEKVGVYYYFFPTYSQGKKILWDGIDRNGFKFIDHFPKEIVKSKNGTELKIELVNGSIFQIIGTDKYDAIRGTNPIGCVFSEYAFQNPMAWETVRPVLAENGGWAAFNTTPNGENHAYDMLKYAQSNDKWFVQILTIDDTGAVSQEIIDEERKTGMTEEMIQQEYYCSFETGGMGAYYNDVLKQAREEDRIGTVPFYIDRDVDVHFDLGINDMMTMWFVQTVGQRFNFLNYYEDNNKAYDFYFKYIKDYLIFKKCSLGIIYLPHDSKKRNMQTGKTDYDLFVEEFGHGKVRVVPIGEVKIGIRAVRAVFPRCWFDEDTCSQGIRCLKNYKREYDFEKKVFRDSPDHNWASHGSDSFRTFAMSIDDSMPQQEEKNYVKQPIQDDESYEAEFRERFPDDEGVNGVKVLSYK